MCEHHVPGAWTRRWDAFLIGSLAAFSVLEGFGLATVGREATLSVYLRRLAGLEPMCRHRHFGRAVMLLFFGWATAHLGWGLLGWEPHHHPQASKEH